MPEGNSLGVHGFSFFGIGVREYEKGCEPLIY